MNEWKIFLAPFLGGVIGYITNDLAIKMLFRPRKAIYIWGWQVPFTPGLIPKQKGRIACSIGKVVSEQLLNAETIKETILSEKSLSILRDKINVYFAKLKDDKRTVEEVLGQFVESEKMELYKNQIIDFSEKKIMEKIGESDLERKIAHMGIEALKEKMQTGLLKHFFNENFYETLENSLEKIVKDMLIQKAPELIRTEVENMEETLLKTTLNDIYLAQQERVPSFTDKVTALYEQGINRYLEEVLDAVGIEKIISDRINSFDAEQLEQMIFGIMKRELKAIVYLGAVLGFFMGFLNLLW